MLGTAGGPGDFAATIAFSPPSLDRGVIGHPQSFPW